MARKKSPAAAPARRKKSVAAKFSKTAASRGKPAAKRARKSDGLADEASLIEVGHVSFVLMETLNQFVLEPLADDKALRRHAEQASDALFRLYQASYGRIFDLREKRLKNGAVEQD